jgi:hypothetical protein
MYESGAVWTFIGPDGSSITMNDGVLPLVLEDVTGNDSPNVRENIEDRPEDDGATAGDFFYGSRPMTWSGVLHGDPATRNQTAIQLQSATRALRGDVTFYSQATGLPPMQASGRLQNLRITRREGIAKSFQLGIICPDPRFYSQTLHTNTGSGETAIAGASFPLVFPISFGGGSGATVTFNVTNAGNFPAPVLIRVEGTIDSPSIKNATTDQTIYVDNLTLVGGEYFDIDTSNRTIVKDDSTNLYGKVRIPASTWWQLWPGTNTIELRASSTPSTGTLTLWWRDSWA